MSMIRSLNINSELLRYGIEFQNSNAAAEMDMIKILPMAAKLEKGYIASNAEVSQSQYVVTVTEQISGGTLVSSTLLNAGSAVASSTVTELTGTYSTTLLSAGTPIRVRVSATTTGPAGGYNVVLRFLVEPTTCYDLVNVKIEA